MKTFSKIAVLFTLLLIRAVVSFAQTTKEKNHHLLSLHHKKAQDDHNNVALHKTATAEFRRKEAKDALIGIKAARATHREMLKTETTTASKVEKEHHKALTRYHKEATKHNASLQKELSKSTPDEQKVQAHIDAVKQSLDNAEKENQYLSTEPTTK